MCSVDDDGGEQRPVKESKNHSLQNRECVKCGQPGVLITRINDPFCKSCFQVYVIHKFRAAIGKTKLIRDGEKVIVAYSGGANSSALLHLIQDGLSERAHRKLRFIPTLLHIDECGALGIEGDSRHDFRWKVAQLMLNSGFPAFIVDLEQVQKMERDRSCQQTATNDVINEGKIHLLQLAKDGCSGYSALPSQADSDQLRSLINSLSSVTSQEDFIRNLWNQLIVSVARQLGFTKVLTADCSTRLSVQVLTDIAQGRGSQIALDTAFCDQRNGDVMFIRPVRDLTSKELVMYNSLFGVDSVFIPTFTTKNPNDSSIGKLTETFILGLQADFPSTVPNIIRTSEKMEPPDFDSNPACAFCQSPLDTNMGQCSALCAIEFSQKISQPKKKMQSGCSQAGTRSGSQDGFQLEDSDQAMMCNSKSHTELDQTLCYGCRVSLHSFVDDMSVLPQFITRVARDTRQRDQLREKISEFLLEDDER